MNLGEDFSHFDIEKKKGVINKNFKTKSGIDLAKKLYLNQIN